MAGYDISTFERWAPSDIPAGVVCPDAGNSALYLTGGWRSNRPIWDEENCSQCLLCWMYCPDSSIVLEEGVMTGIDLDHCKGCGLCAVECKFGAITMINETLAKEGVK